MDTHKDQSPRGPHYMFPLTSVELGSFMESAPFGIAIFNEDLDVIHCNEELISMSASDELSESGFATLPRDLKARLKPYVERVFNTQEPIKEVEFAFHYANESYWIISFSPLRDELMNQQLVGCYMQDITESRKAKNSLRNHDRRMDEHLAMLGHELRNPLAAIVNATDLLCLVQSEDPELDEVKAVLTRQTGAMKSMIDGLLDISRISRGKININRQMVNLQLLLKELIADYRPEAKKLGIALRISGSTEDLWTYADRNRLVQIFGNLISNALKFTPQDGEIRIDIRKTDDELHITVADTGVGMESELLSKVFEPFSQGRQSIERSLGGLGLGLALVKGLVGLHHGKVSASSLGPGLGSEFKVSLPRSYQISKKDCDPCKTLSLKPRNILVVEDNMDAANLLKRILTRCGQSVQLVHNGKDALNLAESYDPDVVLCDIGLPGDLDGYEIAKLLRKRPGFDSKPMIAVTGYGLREDVDKALSAGFDRHMTKPVNFSMLKNLLQELT